MGREIRKRLEKACSDLARKQKAPHLWGFLFTSTFIEKLKNFEGPRYNLNLVVVKIDGKKVLASIFAQNKNLW